MSTVKGRIGGVAQVVISHGREARSLNRHQAFRKFVPAFSCRCCETAARLLALLSLLQSRPDWTGAELAERLGVSNRTVRNDIDRLRELGYPVDASAARPATTGSGSARSCRRCCSTTRRRSRSRSDCGRRPG